MSVNNFFSSIANQKQYLHGMVYSGRKGVNVHYPHTDYNNQWQYNNEFTRPSKMSTRDYVKRCVVECFNDYAPQLVKERVNVERDIIINGDDGVYHYTIWMDK